MSGKSDQSKMSREERLAANLRANLRRRKQAARKVKAVPDTAVSENGPNADKSSP